MMIKKFEWARMRANFELCVCGVLNAISRMNADELDCFDAVWLEEVIDAEIKYWFECADKDRIAGLRLIIWNALMESELVWHSVVELYVVYVPPFEVATFKNHWNDVRQTAIDLVMLSVKQQVQGVLS